MGSGPLKHSRKLFAHLLLTGAFFGLALSWPAQVQAAVGISQQINFQGRLLNGQGAAAPDGYYNIEFRIYQDGDGLTAGNTTGSPAGSLKWTEDYLNTNGKGVLVKNGFLSVQLGSVNPFGNSVDWNQDTLWLSMNVASVNPTCTPFASCTPDGEMTPMKRLSATPYALNAGRLGGLTSAGFIQNTTSPQTADFNITGNGVVGGTMGVNGLLSANAGLTASGAAINLNKNSNFSVDIATGSSTGAVSIGGGLNTFSLNSTALDISTTGVITGATGITSTGTITGGFFSGDGSSLTNLNASNLASGTVGSARVSGNYTGITGTGALATGSIANGFGTISTGNSIATTSTVTGGSLASTVATGTAPITVNSTTKVTNLNADLLDGLDSTAFAAASGSPNYIQNTTSPQTANLYVSAATSGSVAGTFRANAAGSGAILNFLDGTGTSVGAVDAFGDIFAQQITSNDTITANTYGTTHNALTVIQNAASASVPVAIIKGGATPGAGADVLQLQNSSAQSLAGFSNTGQLYLGRAGASGATGSQKFFNSSNANTVTLQSGATSAGAGTGYTLTLPTALGSTGNCLTDTTGTGVLGFSSCAPASGSANYIQNGTAAQTADFNITGTGTVGGNFTSKGATLFKPTTDTTTAFQIQPSASATAIFNVDTSNGWVGIGTNAPGYKLDVNGDINTSGVYRVGGTNVGVARSCTATEVLLGQVTVGGIATGGTCTTAAGGVSVVGAFVNGTSYTNGATIASNTITFGEATAVNPGMVSASTQIFGGDKTFNGLITQNSSATSGTGVSINTTPASGTVTSSLGITNSGAGNVTNGILVNRSGGGTTANAIAISTTGGAITNGLSFSGTITTDITRGSGTLTANGGGGIALQTNSVTRATFDTSNGLYLGTGITAAGPGTFTVSATGSNATGNVGGTLALQGGNATAGNANGGNLNLSGGTGIGTGVNGLVILSTPTFSTNSNDANCYTGGALVANSCTIAATSVNNSSVVLVGFSATGKTATLPDPTILTAGRVVYITAANGSSDFTLSVNGGGVGNVIAMRQNTSATMIWNGNDWTAAGASSSTTLQSAYDNTLQSAGGAELVVSKSSNTNGLTIRDSLSAPVNGTLLSVQTASAAGLLSVNSSVTEYASDAGAETAGASSSTFPASTWAAVGTSTVSRYTTAGTFIATGQASTSVATTTAAGDGVKNTMTTALTANTIYNVSFAVRLSTGTFTDMSVYYSVDGTTASTACVATQAVTTSVWTKVNCSFTAPASGITTGNAMLIRQTGAGTARTIYLDNLSVTLAANYNYATDGSVDNAANFTTNWTSVAGATVSRSTSVGNDASDSAQVVTTTTGQGVRNKLSINPLQSTLYRVTVYASSSTTGFNNLTIRYSRDGGTSFVNCADYNTQTVSGVTTDFTKITCYITTDGTAASSPYVYFTQTDSTARTFYIDTFTIALSSNTTPNVQIGGGLYGGPVTLLTVDRAASAPIASNNDAFLGSLYYDTSLGKLQCYEADGWGACGSSPDNIVTISPEYTNAVMHGTGVGTMTSDICSSTLNINNGTSGQPTICGTNETYNFYRWTSPQASAQTYSIYVTYQLPATFKAFASGQTAIMGRTDSTNSTVQYQIYKNDPSAGLTACGSAITVSTGVSSAWKVGAASGAADPSTCGFAPSNSIVFKIDVVSSANANAYVGNLNFTFSNN